MTLTIFDPITGKHVTITRPEKRRSYYDAFPGMTVRTPPRG